jgi:1-acyl-sn-glycerol-3-phosphate acyltransferase
MRWLAALVLRLLGWQTVYTLPPGPKSVLLVYPHTSNWDFALGVLYKTKYRLVLKWAGKDSLFRWPLRAIFVGIGGVPINRRQPSGMIGQLVAAFAGSASLCICITPEGTRGRIDHWKTGFYRLALAAGVPVGLGFIDYGGKRIGIERWVTLSGDEEADLQLLREYYADKTGLYPENAGAIRFRDRRAP